LPLWYQQVEKVFRGLKDGNWLNWGPMYHWTDSKIRVHAFYCMLGISLLNYLHTQMQKVCPGITVEQLKEELQDIKQYVLLTHPRATKVHTTATIQESS
jgi:transposase